MVSASAVDPSSARVDALRGWLDAQAVSVPEGWLEACLQWLRAEHGDQECARFDSAHWRQAVFEQWLHSDLAEFACPILPPINREDGDNTALLLEGELCLQVRRIFSDE